MAIEVVVPTPAQRPLSNDPVRADGSRPRTGPRWLLPGVLAAGIVALLICLLAGGTVGASAVSGLPDAGAGTRWALPMAAFIAETAAVLAFGAALLAGTLIPAVNRQSRATAARIRALSTA